MLRRIFLVLLVISFSETEVFAASADRANSSDTAILYIFTGSDWCANCRRLEKNILSDPQFMARMDSAKIKIEILDFPQRKPLSPETAVYNGAMSEKLGFTGEFPTLVVYTGIKTFKAVIYKNQEQDVFLELLLSTLQDLNE